MINSIAVVSDLGTTSGAWSRDPSAGTNIATWHWHPCCFAHFGESTAKTKLNAEQVCPGWKFRKFKKAGSSQICAMQSAVTCCTGTSPLGVMAL